MDCSPPGSSVNGILQARIWEWVPFPSPGDLPNPGIKPGSPALQADSLPSVPPEKPTCSHYFQLKKTNMKQTETSLKISLCSILHSPFPSVIKQKIPIHFLCEGGYEPWGLLLVGMSYCRVCFSERGQYQGAGVGAGTLQDGVNTQQDCCEKSRRARASDTDASYVIAFDPISSLLYLSSCSLHPSLLSANNLMDFTTFSSSLPSSLFQKVFHLRAVMGCGMKRH